MSEVTQRTNTNNKRRPQHIAPISAHAPSSQPDQRVSELKAVLEDHLATGQVLTVGQAPVMPEPVHPGVALVRYGVLAFSMACLTFASAWRFGWPLSMGLVIFASGTLAGVTLLALIETRQIVSVLNSILDYMLNRQRIDKQLDLLERLLDAKLKLDANDARHRQTLERQRFILDNQVTIFKLVEGDDRARNALIQSVRTDASPGAFIDSINEDNMVNSMRSFVATLYDVDEKRRRVHLGREGVIRTMVPWDETNTAMAPEDRQIALGILKRIESRVPPVLQYDGGRWYLNLQDYPTPARALDAFDVVYTGG